VEFQDFFCREQSISLFGASARSLRPVRFCMYNAATDNENVKHLVRNTRSKQYFNHGQWTANVKEAQDFRSVETARAVAMQCGLNNVELVLQPGVESSETDDDCSAVFLSFEHLQSVPLQIMPFNHVVS